MPIWRSAVFGLQGEALAARSILAGLRRQRVSKPRVIYAFTVISDDFPHLRDDYRDGAD